MITNRQKNFLVYFCTRSFFLGIGFSLIFKKCNNDSWITFIIGTILGIGFCKLFKYILDKKGKKKLSEYLNELGITGKIVRILLILLSIIILNELLFVLQIFAKSFFLINSKTFFLIIPIVYLIVFIAFKGYNLLCYICECLFPVAITIFVLALYALIFKVDLTNLQPYFNTNILNFFQGIIFYFSLSTTPLLLLLDMDFEDSNILKSYIGSSSTLIILAILLSGILGQILVNIYRFPEYMILKEIKMFNFIENIENIVSLIWLIDLFVVLSLSATFLKNILPKKYNNYSFLTIITLVVISICYIFGNNYINDLFIYKYIPYFLLILNIIIILILTLKKQKT